MNIYFCNIDLPRNFTGIEVATINRANQFVECLNIIPTILTVKYNHQLNERREELYKSGKLNSLVKILNMYEYFQEADDNNINFNVQPQSEINDFSNIVYKKVVGTENFKVFNKDGDFLFYYVCDDKGNLSHINYFKNKIVVKRDYYNSNKILSKTQIINEHSQKIEKEIYYNKSGKVCMTCDYNNEQGFSIMNNIYLYNSIGLAQAHFNTEDDLIAYWIDKLIEGEETSSIFVLDRIASYINPLKNTKSKNIKKVAVLHSSHIRGGKDVMKSPINPSMKPLFVDINSVDRIVTLTDTQRQHLILRFGNESKYVTIPHALKKMSDIITFRKRKKNKLIYVARLAPEKRHFDAINIISKVKEEIPDVELHLFGNGIEKKKIQQLIETKGLQKNIILRGHIENLEEEYLDSQIAILTSHIEGFSLFLLESLAHGCPIISYNIDYGPADLIDNEKNGYLVPFANSELFAQYIVNLLSNEILAAEYSYNSYLKSLNFSKENVMKKWKELINSLNLEEKMRC